MKCVLSILTTLFFLLLLKNTENFENPEGKERLSFDDEMKACLLHLLP